MVGTRSRLTVRLDGLGFMYNLNATPYLRLSIIFSSLSCCSPEAINTTISAYPYHISSVALCVTHCGPKHMETPQPPPGRSGKLLDLFDSDHYILAGADDRIDRAVGQS